MKKKLSVRHYISSRPFKSHQAFVLPQKGMFNSLEQVEKTCLCFFLVFYLKINLLFTTGSVQNKFIWKELTVTQCVGLSFLKVNRKCPGPKQYFSLRVMCFLVSTLSDSHPGLQGGEERLPIWHILPRASPETRIYIIHLIERWFP